MFDNQPSFTDAEYEMRSRTTRRERFLAMMDETVPWVEWVRIVEPFIPHRHERGGRKPVPAETMLRMYLLQVWFHLSDEAAEDEVWDSHAMRKFMRVDFAGERVPDATTLCKFRHVLEANRVGQALFDELGRILDEAGLVVRGGSVVDATIVSAPSSTKNRAGARDPEAHQTRKGRQWYFGFKAHTGVDAGNGYVHHVALTGANVSDVEMAHVLVRPDDHVVYADAGYAGVAKRPEVAGDPGLSGVEWRVAVRKGTLKTMHPFDRAVESRKASARSKVEHPYLIVKREFASGKTRYRGLAKNLNQYLMLFASANLLTRARAVASAGA